MDAGFQFETSAKVDLNIKPGLMPPKGNMNAPIMPKLGFYSTPQPHSKSFAPLYLPFFQVVGEGKQMEVTAILVETGQLWIDEPQINLTCLSFHCEEVILTIPSDTSFFKLAGLR